MCISVFCICAEVDATHERQRSTTSGSSIGRLGGLRPTPSNKLGATLKMPATSLSYSSYLLTCMRREHAATLVRGSRNANLKDATKFFALRRRRLPAIQRREWRVDWTRCCWFASRHFLDDEFRKKLFSAENNFFEVIPESLLQITETIRPKMQNRTLAVKKWAIPYFLVLPGSELSITEITEYNFFSPSKPTFYTRVWPQF